MLSRRALLAALPVSALLAGAPALTGAVRAAPSWAPAATAAIHPGVMTDTNGGQCTSNFVFTDPAGAVYIGQAAHCSGTGAATETDGCTTDSLPLGTQVQVAGASRPGRLVYNSWIAMQAAGEKNRNACAHNDFALVLLDPADARKVNPTVPSFGGPTRLGTGTVAGSQVFSYGNSSLRLGIPLLSPKTGVSLGDEAGGWTRSVYTLTPGIPGDSGSAFLNERGEAVGVLSTLAILPLPGSNGVSDLAKAVAYARSHGGPQVTLATGTEPFRGTAGLLDLRL
ncbi:MAG: hypothetical protein AVDCRST_MAG76-2309 [uncultured Acidimicrobiales bacterium]|uniref:Serine protease n=1 Tax=uncultured Acidimicrobiales bacterium TaxID=310071 RepID=A0A6J4III5_9ACTN|nr:MAG: hypothetical protein AVDCRST_MAG76-2309 [uncultured Acidimicrobiales bacterium]